ncbi:MULTISPECIES: phosphatase PAP2 family protein [Prosthecochloris]|uniref:Phosphatase PAP2 family protein n=1 Tax=Prosthecochloris vibrioformis TaxID=1098 RepID=A0A5C4S2E6_PROVB|nr:MULTISPECIES: phosphatase PAP2 family protein [Prosthecochloris]ANT66018.1 undecaprenyl pyrophosphate phosphatase [Prosthecochloris sp. CIB 2401]TNJ37660.1 phosphatase PAP2 family protein [Prosthecochloris vibrioformis]
MEWLYEQDAALFVYLNGQLIHPLTDGLMVFLTDTDMSWHIFALAALFMVQRRRLDGVMVLLLTLLAVGLADWITSGVLKPLFARTRPCFIIDGCRLLVDQGRTWSFASSHASNSVAVASMIWLFFARGDAADRVFTAIMACYAFLVAYSRVYVGVHYPSDILAGALIGVGCSLLLYAIYAWIVKNFMQRGHMKTAN